MGAATLFLEATAAEFRRYKELSDRALVQVGEAEWFYVPARESNCLAVVVKHVGGNLRSRWTDFLTADGEKPDRVRDAEFELFEGDTVQGLLEGWEGGWAAVLGTLATLTEADLGRTITIRSQPHSVPEAIQRSLAHTAYHGGQIVQLAKMIRAEGFENLSVPKGQSAQFLRLMEDRYRK
ncbi:MAG: DUF1572 family protein [Meiothermus sp.]|nr:DUF1572 family protein [Meiothermus sp.]